MDSALRACAIFTGSVASLSVALSLSWWLDPAFGYVAGYAVLFVAFMTGLLGFFVMFGMLFERLQGRRSKPLPTDIAALVWKTIPRRLLIWLGLVLAIAFVSFGVAWGRAGQWESGAPYSWRNCHWPLYANHDTEHLCVSHARWLEVNLETARILVGFGALFCIVDCLAFTTLSRIPRPTRTRARYA